MFGFRSSIPRYNLLINRIYPIEAGKTTLNPKDFDLHRLLDIKFCPIFLDEYDSMV
jgi:hypothetical protein